MALDLVRVAAIAVPTLLVHEVGHILAARALRLPWRLVLTRHGPAVIVGTDDVLFTRRQLVLTSAAGPLANVAICAGAYELGQALVVLVGLEILVVNLFPVRSTDGARLLRPGRAIARARAAASAH